MDYKNGKIYQILNHINDEIYVGSTTQPLFKRLYEHKIACEHRNCNFYKLMKEFGTDNFYIELIEMYPCNSKEELNSREGHYIRERATLNKVIVGRSKKQWYEDNRDVIQEKRHTYYEEHTEEKKTYDKQRYEENKEFIKEKMKNYYEQNKEEIRDRCKEKVVCALCGSSVGKYKLARHQETKKCKPSVKSVDN